jgi:hypothetical protein
VLLQCLMVRSKATLCYSGYRRNKMYKFYIGFMLWYFIKIEKQKNRSWKCVHIHMLTFVIYNLTLNSLDKIPSLETKHIVKTHNIDSFLQWKLETIYGIRRGDSTLLLDLQIDTRRNIASMMKSKMISPKLPKILHELIRGQIPKQRKFN